MSNENKILTITQALTCACDDIDFATRQVNDDTRKLLNSISDTIVDSRTLLNEVAMTDKVNSLLVSNLKDEYQKMVDFINEKRLMSEYIKHKEKYD